MFFLSFQSCTYIAHSRSAGTHVFDQKGMQHDISESIILKGGEQGWLLEHKHRHNLRRYKPKS